MRPVPDKRRILLVDDDEILLALFEELSEEAGYETTTAATAGEALAIVRAAPLHVLLTDVMLPDRRGDVLARLSREIQPGLRVVYMSGYPSGAGLHLQGPPPDAWLAKPFTLEALRRAVEP